MSPIRERDFRLVLKNAIGEIVDFDRVTRLVSDDESVATVFAKVGGTKNEITVRTTGQPGRVRITPKILANKASGMFPAWPPAEVSGMFVVEVFDEETFTLTVEVGEERFRTKAARIE